MGLSRESRNTQLLRPYAYYSPLLTITVAPDYPHAHAHSTLYQLVNIRSGNLPHPRVFTQWGLGTEATHWFTAPQEPQERR